MLPESFLIPLKPGKKEGKKKTWAFPPFGQIRKRKGGREKASHTIFQVRRRGDQELVA